MTETTSTTPEARARKRAKDFTDVMWHVASYIIINAFLWTLDIVTGGLNWAFWVTIGWGIGVAFHLAFYWIGENDEDGRAYQRFLAKEQKLAETKSRQ